MRLQSEHQALSGVPVHNRLLASTLTDLLDERKDMTTGGKTTGGLSKKYGIDEDLLKRLASHVNSPSIGDTVVSRHVTADGEQLMLMKAAWVEPSAKDASS
ncbi:hypothetical protein FRB99_008086 [Tulasnella sp. 403]|nr:hypothetical protein FRB99_008086 [Tulasnella sp. 403]